MSEKLFAVAIHYNDNERGKIVYNPETKTADVRLADPEWRQKVEDFLQTSYTLEDAVGLADYEARTVNPLDSVDSFKLALTRLWEDTEVQVDWSWPVDAE